MSWLAFQGEAPDLAAAATELLDRYELVVLGTNTRSRHPRLSLVHPVVVGEELVIGTLAGDRKTADLRRDERCSLHCFVGHRDHDEGEFKAALSAVELLDEPLRVITRVLARPEIRWQPTAAFALTVKRASLARRGVPKVVWHAPSATG